MSDLNLDELRRLLAEATPGPLVFIPAGNRPEIFSTRGPNDMTSGPLVCRVESLRPQPDAHLIVAAVNALPALIAAARERDALKAECEQLRDSALGQMHRGNDLFVEVERLRAAGAYVAELILKIDWTQVVLNRDEPCCHPEGNGICGRANRWAGHPEHHKFISLYIAARAALEKP